MKTPHHKTNPELDSFELVSNELQEEFANIFYSLDDAIIID